MERMVRSVTFVRVADWLNAYVVRQHADKETLRQEWMATGDRWAARAGWDLTAERVAKSPDGLALPALLDRIESEMASADPEVQWTMNNTLAAIGIHFPKHRKRAIAIAAGAIVCFSGSLFQLSSDADRAPQLKASVDMVDSCQVAIPFLPPHSCSGFSFLMI
jgi:hypothetical protein